MRNETSKVRSRTSRKFISFFAGARGLDIGLETAGLGPVAVNEMDKKACETIRLNQPDLRLYAEDIRQLSPERLRFDLGDELNDLFAIAGGPPCQAFSTAGRRLGLNDDRGNVFLHFIDLIVGLRPKYAIFENVRGLLSAPLRHRPHEQRGPGFSALQPDELPGGALSHILRRLEAGGYSTTFTLYNTANFGVPQIRERLIFIASRDGHHVPHLRPTHDAIPKGSIAPWRTFRDALSGRKMAGTNALSFPEKRLKFYRLLEAGQNWRNLPTQIQEEAMGGSWLSGGGKTGFFRRLSWDKPSPTLVTRPNMKATDLCHPSELRPLSVEEYATLQTFPEDYRFSGSLDDQYRQIGNAVPCVFAEAIGRHLIEFDEGRLKETAKPSITSRYVDTDHITWKRNIDKASSQMELQGLR
jgi:DNA (cytosine-5)-methyltransferase 1